MSSITISITIPKQLESELQTIADNIGISRSRFIGNILLDWQKQKNKSENDCTKRSNGFCNHFKIRCTAPQHEAETCAGYKKG